MTEPLTEGLRRRLRERIECPTCYQSMPGDSMRSLADAVGLPHTVVWRFLKGGDMTGRNLDKVAAYLDCVDALAAGEAIRAIEDEMLDKVAAAVVRDVTHERVLDRLDAVGEPRLPGAAIKQAVNEALAAIERIRRDDDGTV